ncbi:MAG TPA: hypothetical protein VMO47_17400, partial [Rhodothermales bacterium]|nr:hypothetical protein [Rhodothermales bacterium]
MPGTLTTFCAAYDLLRRVYGGRGRRSPDVVGYTNDFFAKKASLQLEGPYAPAVEVVEDGVDRILIAGR